MPTEPLRNVVYRCNGVKLRSELLIADFLPIHKLLTIGGGVYEVTDLSREGYTLIADCRRLDPA